MAQRQSGRLTSLPLWLIILASVGIAAHFVVLGARALSGQSGPWVTPFGNSQAVPPQFAADLDEVANPYYLRPLRMSHDYHFVSNRPELPAVYFEVELKDE